LGITMGQAPEDVTVAGNETTASDLNDGVAVSLARHFQG